MWKTEVVSRTHTAKRAQWIELWSHPLEKQTRLSRYLHVVFTATFLGCRLLLHGVNRSRIQSRRPLRFQVLLVNQTVVPREPQMGLQNFLQPVPIMQKAKAWGLTSHTHTAV